MRGCAKTHEEKFKKEKVSVHCWQWDNKTTKENPVTTNLKDEITKQLKVKESIKAPGVLTSPSISQDDKHQYAKDKSALSIKIIMRTGTRLYQAHA